MKLVEKLKKDVENNNKNLISYREISFCVKLCNQGSHLWKQRDAKENSSLRNKTP